MDEGEHIVPGWTRWSTWCLSGVHGAWMDDVEHMVLQWMRWSTWCPDGQNVAHAFSLFSQVTWDELQESTMKIEGACPRIGVGCSLCFIIDKTIAH